jgi:hypothetical protein
MSARFRAHASASTMVRCSAVIAAVVMSIANVGLLT